MATKETLALFSLCSLTLGTAREPIRPLHEEIFNPEWNGRSEIGSKGSPCFWGGKIYQDGEGWRCNYNEYDPKYKLCNSCGCHDGVIGGTKKGCGLVSKCPSGWVDINQGCYKFLQKKASWHNADKECTKIGGKLAIKIEDDLPSLIQYAKLRHGGHSWWIGMSDISQEGRWFWTDGSPGISKYNAWWASGQPNNLKGNEDCAHLWNGGDMLLGDTRCSADMAWDGKFEFRPLCQYGSNVNG